MSRGVLTGSLSKGREALGLLNLERGSYQKKQACQHNKIQGLAS